MRERGVMAPGLVAAVLAMPDSALAHTGAGGLGGFVAGVAHPRFGPDHLVAMLAVGLWSSQLGNPALWVLPVTGDFNLSASDFIL